MAPLLRFDRLARSQYTVGEQYNMRAEHNRSAASHNSYFAEVDAQWRKLVFGSLGSKFPDSNALRAHALIRCNYCYKRWEDASTPAAAQRMAEFMQEFMPLAEVSADGQRVWVKTAMSQSRAEMGEKVFKASKKATLDYIARLVDLYGGKAHAG